MNYGLDIEPDAIRVATDTADGVDLESVPTLTAPTDAEPTLATDTDANSGDSLLSNGVLMTDDDAEETLEALLEDVLGPDAADDGRLCYTTSGTVVDGAEPIDARRDAVASVVDDWGLEATPINSGFAVVYDQFADDNYTGLGVRIGPQTTSVALAYYGVPAVSCSLAKGSEWVIDRAADDTGRDPAQVTTVLESFVFDPDAATDEIEAALATAFDALVGDLADTLEREAGEADIQRGLAVPLTVAGSGAVAGLEYLIAGRFDSALPISVRDPRRADEPAASATRGALEAAKDGVEGHDAVAWSPTDATDGDENDGFTTVTEPTGEMTLTFDDSLEDSAETDRARADDAIEQLFDRLADRDDEILSIRADLETVSDALDDLDARAANADTVRALEATLEGLEDDLIALEAESERYASGEVVSSLEDDFDVLSTAFDRHRADVDELESAMNDEFDTFEASIEALETTTADEQAVLDARIGDLVADLDEIIADTNTLDERLESLQSEQESLETMAASAADLDAVTETVSRFEDELGAVDETIDRLGTRADGFAGRLEEQAIQLDDADDRLTARAEQADEERRQLGDDIEAVEAALEAELGALERDFETLERRFDELDDTVTERIDTLAADRDEPVSELRAAIDARLDTLEAELEAVADTEDRTNRLDDRMSDHATRLETHAETLEDYDGRLESLTTDVADLAATLDGADKSSEAQLSSIETRVDELEARVETDREDDPEAIRAELETVQDRLEIDDAPSFGAQLATGGGSAGVVAGSVAALTGAVTIGAAAAVLGLVVIAVVVGHER